DPADPADESGPVLPAPADPPADAPAGNGQAGASRPAGESEQIPILNWEQTLELVKRHKGRVVVVDLWSHHCPPCLRELPHFVALSKMDPGRVACLGVNLDYYGSSKEPPESFRDGVRDTLKEHDADFVNVISNVPATELVDRLGFAAVPAVFVFDREGNQVKRFDNDNAGDEFTYEKDVVPFVESLLTDGS
ncbi:MAG TPA: TlpA disulfide reductase family protein, partial [Planctomycetaceae bacterium]|nr:TlpA disulfide reductase family protein [Planctomycetaceae bacterium]